MRYFLDTEFMEDGKTIELISLGVVSQDGREFYAESLDANLNNANSWVKENVVPHLWHKRPDFYEANAWIRDGGVGGLLNRSQIANGLRQFVIEDEASLEFWGYYADYDWVVLCQLFGTMLDLPEGWPMFCMDIKQLAVEKGNPSLPEQSGREHVALDDARWNREAYDYLRMEE